MSNETRQWNCESNDDDDSRSLRFVRAQFSILLQNDVCVHSSMNTAMQQLMSMFRYLCFSLPFSSSLICFSLLNIVHFTICSSLVIAARVMLCFVRSNYDLPLVFDSKQAKFSSSMKIEQQITLWNERKNLKIIKEKQLNDLNINFFVQRIWWYDNNERGKYTTTLFLFPFAALWNTINCPDSLIGGWCVWLHHVAC